MEITVHFYSYFKDLAGCAQTQVTLEKNKTVGDLLGLLGNQFPRWAVAERATLVAIGVEYALRDQLLQPGNEVSLFPPVQGG